jgi:hypothetical protein
MRNYWGFLPLVVGATRFPDSHDSLEVMIDPNDGGEDDLIQLGAMVSPVEFSSSLSDLFNVFQAIQPVPEENGAPSHLREFNANQLTETATQVQGEHRYKQRMRPIPGAPEMHSSMTLAHWKGDGSNLSFPPDLPYITENLVVLSALRRMGPNDQDAVLAEVRKCVPSSTWTLETVTEFLTAFGSSVVTAPNMHAMLLRFHEAGYRTQNSSILKAHVAALIPKTKDSAERMEKWTARAKLWLSQCIEPLLYSNTDVVPCIQIDMDVGGRTVRAWSLTAVQTYRYLLYLEGEEIERIRGQNVQVGEKRPRVDLQPSEDHFVEISVNRCLLENPEADIQSILERVNSESSRGPVSREEIARVRASLLEWINVPFWFHGLMSMIGQGGRTYELIRSIILQVEPQFATDVDQRMKSWYELCIEPSRRFSSGLTKKRACIATQDAYKLSVDSARAFLDDRLTSMRNRHL